MSYNTLAWAVDDGILTLTLNRPEQMNAFTVEMADELEAAFHRASDDDAVRAIVVTGAGKAFCAGMDLTREGNVFGLDESLAPTLEDMNERLATPAIQRGVRDTGGRVALAIFNCKKPVICAINGAAVGIGATMTLAMDIRLASEKARIGFVFGKIGITPEACSTWFLPRIVGMSQALEWVYAADILSAEEALAGGLVKAVLPPEQLLPEAYRLARKFTQNRSPVAVALARQMMYRNAAAPHPLEAHKVDSLAIYYASLKDGKEGVQSFLERRTPEFTARCSTDLPPFYADWAK
ncbi:crotonase/enoyl-CoA hydratase family protein [Ottowia sp.]|jgi:enoyl-CoA hydratase/carnithine racemase|uniref:crotonase/enoyl-CoA hydratase family protein n=1 Tax=Ottowia sp. TaxID=1898956 RepID=UPI0025D1C339|nr:crotonase/enoyl-CoA hydratase family protein [Ottowia sp.]MBK6614817.1 crotonase/enoyl-CoA hydratase family protein [Ottowia sp.]MBK6745901.1 crotonase/enoyl-CoA hydratase family protein [Ottowia sp.]